MKIPSKHKIEAIYYACLPTQSTNNVICTCIRFTDRKNLPTLARLNGINKLHGINKMKWTELNWSKFTELTDRQCALAKLLRQRRKTFAKKRFLYSHTNDVQSVADGRWQADSWCVDTGLVRFDSRWSGCHHHHFFLIFIYLFNSLRVRNTSEQSNR